MGISKPLFYDGFDVFTDDLDWGFDQVDAELTKRLLHITTARGVAAGLTLTPAADAIGVAAGEAYSDDGSFIDYAGNTIAVVVGDINKYLVLYNVPTNTTPSTHPVTGAVVQSRVQQVATLALTASPSAQQVKLAKITNASGGNPPTLNTDPPNRDVLSLGVSGVSGGTLTNPFPVVANDGSGDHSTLQAAINALPSTGGMIFVKAGTYDVTAITTITKSAVLIQGSGPSTIIRMSGAAQSRVLDIDGSGVGGIEDVFLADLAFDWDVGDPGAGQTNAAIKVLSCTGFTIRDCVFRDQQGINKPVAIWLADAANDGLIEGCRGADAEIYTGILVAPSAGAKGNKIQGNRFKDATLGIHLLAGSDENIVLDNDLDGNGSTTPLSVGIELTDAEHNVIGLNRVNGFALGVRVNGAASTKGNVITGNTIGATSVGITLGSNSTKNIAARNDLTGAVTGYTDAGSNNIHAPNVT